MVDTGPRDVSGLETVTDGRERGLLRLADLRQRIGGGDGSAVAEDALQELQTSYEELQVTEEELRAQTRELAEAYGRLVHERQRYRDLFEHAPVGYLVTDVEGVIRDANGTGSRLLGRASQYLRGKPLRLFVAPDERVELSRWLRRLREADEALTGEFDLQPGGGSVTTVRCVVVPVRSARGDIEALRWVVHPVDESDGQTARVGHLRAVGPSPGSVETTADRSLEIAVLDPQALFVRNLDVLLETLLPGRARVAGATDDPAELPTLVDRTDPDLVVVTVPFLDGPEHRALRALRERDGARPVLVLAGRVDGPDGEVARDLVDQGLSAVLPRSAAPDALVGAMLATASGWTVLDGSVARLLLGPGRPLHEHLRDGLNDEDLQLWRWIAMGRSDADIAAERNVSTRTVKRRVADLYERLGVDSRVEAAMLAGYHGLAAPGDLGADGS